MVTFSMLTCSGCSVRFSTLSQRMTMRARVDGRNAVLSSSAGPNVTLYPIFSATNAERSAVIKAGTSDFAVTGYNFSCAIAGRAAMVSHNNAIIIFPFILIPSMWTVAGLERLADLFLNLVSKFQRSGYAMEWLQRSASAANHDRSVTQYA